MPSPPIPVVVSHTSGRARAVERVVRGAGLAVSGFGASGLALTAIGVLSVAMGMWSPARAQARAASPAWVSGAVGWRGHRL